MSTYDAYNLSLRDSTEFTVPTGGSSGDSEDNQFSIATLTIDTSNMASGQTMRISGPFIFDEAGEDEGEEIKVATPMYDIDPLDAVNNMLIAKIVLYYGKAVIFSTNIASVSGNISETSPYSSYYQVTGDATIVMNRGTM